MRHTYPHWHSIFICRSQRCVIKVIEDYSDRILNEVDEELARHTTFHLRKYNEIARAFNNDPKSLGFEVPPKSENDLYHTRTLVSMTLLTHHDMAKVWKSINTRIYKITDPDLPQSLSFSSYLERIKDALYGGGYWQSLPPKEREDEYNELIDCLNNVAEKLNKVGCREGALGLMDEEQYDDIQVKLGDSWGGLHPADAGLFYSIPELLTRYANLLQTEQRHKNHLLINRPNSDDARVSYFARSLYTSHMKRFDTPLYGVISTIAGIFYPDHDTSPEKIRASIRSMK